jgi:hypothetical protein
VDLVEVPSTETSVAYGYWEQKGLTYNIRVSPSIQALKYSLKSNISSKPFYYYTGSRLGQILHSRLRMQCSSLNQHLYRKNIVDSPNCICGLTESTTHYLFHCLRYTAQRQMHIPIDLTTEILLKLILIRFPGISLYNNQTGLEVYVISNFKL